MPFSQATITSVNLASQTGNLVTFTWTSTSPAGTWYQIYVDLALVDWTQNLTATVAVAPPLVSVDIGTVLAGEQQTDFSSSIVGYNRFATLSWEGGTFESPEIAGFYVYSGPEAGEPISFTTPVATVTAYPQGIITDGYGYGGFGDGGFGEAANAYEWTSGVLAGGVWNFGVAPFDTAGNKGTAQTTTVTIVAPPLEPALRSDRTRLHYSFDQSTEEATITWLASPSA